MFGNRAKKLVVLALLGVLVVGFVALSESEGSRETAITLETRTEIIEDITPREAYDFILDNRGNQDFVILDVRTPEEYRAGHIPGAVNLDFYTDTFREELNKLDKNKKYLIYCRSGRRSGIVLGIAKELGFTEAYNMLGGIIQWEEEGLPIER